jgi:hypothetical protein
VADVWLMIAEAMGNEISQANPGSRSRLSPAIKDQFIAAPLGGITAARLVLLYYLFLNLAKAFALTRSLSHLLGRARHIISEAVGAEPYNVDLSYPRHLVLPMRDLNFALRMLCGNVRSSLAADGICARHNPLEADSVLSRSDSPRPRATTYCLRPAPKDLRLIDRHGRIYQHGTSIRETLSCGQRRHDVELVAFW